MENSPNDPSVLIPVIIAGGSGQRLWPLSRTEHPKPFLTLPQGGTLLGKTVQRAASLPGVREILTIIAEPLLPMARSLITQALIETGSEEAISCTASFIGEPCGRNTAAAIAIAALWARERYGDNATLLILPADHLIEDQTAFADAVACARAQAMQHRLTTFGITPTRAETGFGYIETGALLNPDHLPAAYAIARFVEKPPAAEAQRLVESGHAFWNAGMFCLNVGDACAAFAKHADVLWRAADNAWQHVKALLPNVWALDEAHFSQVPGIAFDRAIMERATNGAVVCCRFDWNDIGAWPAWTDLVEANNEGNRLHGDVVVHDSHNTRVYAESRLVTTLGVDDLIVVETADAVLVAHHDHAQEVRALTETLAACAHPSSHTPNTVLRPWGRYTVLRESAGVKIKEIEVLPGAALSLQRHRFRSEHWVVTQGSARVTRDEDISMISTNESTFIPVGVKHRLENPGDTPLIIIEVQCGSYVGEDDIERFDDVYGRRVTETP